MTSSPLRTLLVGAFARRGASLLLQHLPSGCPLLLDPDLENPYDANAIRVLVASASIPEGQHEALAAELPSFGSSLEELLADGLPPEDSEPEEWPEPVCWLGFVAASGGRPLAKRAGESLVGNREVLAAMEAGEIAASLVFGADGSPEVVVARVSEAA